SQRLASRGREDANEIAKRIARTAEINTNLENCIEIQNDDAVEIAGNELVNLISVTEKQLA
ncbi:MAG: phnN, partial [Mucilaginibacter sp.]|nr:phnN [Mucilaginibacter sp.]